MKTYCSVRIDKKSWTDKEVTIEQVEKNGLTVQPSRLIGDYDVFCGTKKVATLFSSKIKAAVYALG